MGEILRLFLANEYDRDPSVLDICQNMAIEDVHQKAPENNR